MTQLTADELRQIRERCEESRWIVRVEYAGAIHTFGPWDWNRAVTERAGYVNLDQVTAASIEEVESDVQRLLAEVDRLTAAQTEHAAIQAEIDQLKQRVDRAEQMVAERIASWVTTFNESNHPHSIIWHAIAEEIRKGAWRSAP
ncbi:MAG: hypothetical protein ACTHU0_27095 [Kofleriaceae bacterium]